jgi:hypothetical protein
MRHESAEPLVRSSTLVIQLVIQLTIAATMVCLAHCAGRRVEPCPEWSNRASQIENAIAMGKNPTCFALDGRPKKGLDVAAWLRGRKALPNVKR